MILLHRPLGLIFAKYSEIVGSSVRALYAEIFEELNENSACRCVEEFEAITDAVVEKYTRCEPIA